MQTVACLGARKFPWRLTNTFLEEPRDNFPGMLTFCGWHRIRPEGAKPPRDKAGADSRTVRAAGSGRAGDGQQAGQGQRAGVGAGAGQGRHVPGKDSWLGQGDRKSVV